MPTTIDLATATPLAPSFMTGAAGSVSMPGNLSVAGTSSFTGAITAGASITAAGALTSQSLEGCPVVGTGTGQYSSMAAAYAAASAGQTILISPNWAETFSASLTMNKNNCGFLFLGAATISMGSFQIIISPSTNGAFIRSMAVSVLITGISPVFTYNGNAEAFKVGTSASNTQGIYLENFAINLTQGGTPAGASAIGLRLNSTIVYEVHGVSIYCQAASQIGLLLDGTGNFTGNGHLTNLNISVSTFNATALKLSNNSFINVFNNVNLLGVGPVGTGIDLTTGSITGNAFNGFNIEGFTTGISHGAGAVQNRGNVTWFEGNTTDIAWGTSVNNRYAIGFSTAGAGVGPIQTDGGSTGNVADVIGGTLLNVQGATGILTGNSSDQTIYTYTLPARILGPGKGIRIRVWMSQGATADTPVMKLNFGAFGLISSTASGTSTQTTYMEAVVFNNSGVTNAQTASQVQNFSAATSTYNTFGGLTGTVDTTAAVIITATFNESNAHQLTGKQFIVELIQ